MPEPRESVKRMRPYVPPTGGRNEMLRLDFNENTVGCSPRVTEFLRKSINGEIIATYPDYDGARRSLAAFFGVGESEMLLTNGTDEAIQVLINTFVEPGDEVIVLTPSYAMYRFYAEVAGAHLVEIAYREETSVDGQGTLRERQETRDKRLFGLSSFLFPLSSILSAITSRTKAILLANPNNPTGTAIPCPDLEVVLGAAPNACVLIDEAYFEFYGRTFLPRLKDFDNLFVSRTFSKAHGMAAMRMGCLFSNSANAGVMRKAQSPYSVNMLAAMAATEAIKDPDFTRSYVNSALAGRQSIFDALGGLGIRHWSSEANFVLFDAGDKADECLARCRAAGVLIRDRRHEIPGALRVTAGPPEQVARFAAVIEGIFGGRR